MYIKIENYLIPPNNTFPNNKKFPLLHYRQAIHKKNITAEKIEKILMKNDWHNIWRNGIYTYHHYHSNTHEALVIYEGHCQVEIGGINGKILSLETADVMIIPAGVSHKNIFASSDFKCMGAYPFDIQYNIKYGKANERPEADQEINHTSAPQTDPIFGKDGPLIEYWHNCRFVS